MRLNELLSMKVLIFRLVVVMDVIICVNIERMLSQLGKVNYFYFGFFLNKFSCIIGITWPGFNSEPDWLVFRCETTFKTKSSALMVFVQYKGLTQNQNIFDLHSKTAPVNLNLIVVFWNLSLIYLKNLPITIFYLFNFYYWLKNWSSFDGFKTVCQSWESGWVEIRFALTPTFSFFFFPEKI